jgi:hypothetical protein
MHLSSAGVLQGIEAYWMLKQCPRCRVTIEKNGGCNSMVCRACTHQFRWSDAPKHPRRVVAERFLRPYKMLHQATLLLLATVVVPVILLVVSFCLSQLASATMWLTTHLVSLSWAFFRRVLGIFVVLHVLVPLIVFIRSGQSWRGVEPKGIWMVLRHS